MKAVILALVLLYNGMYALLASESQTVGVGAVLAKLAIDPDFDINLEINRSTEVSYLEEVDGAFSMFETGTGLNLVQYLQEKLYEEEVEAFKQDKSLIDAAIVEYHKYLELTKNWVDQDTDNKFVYIPSKLMDFVWHWHILHTYEYHLMCNKQFNGKFLHHRPYFGAEKESNIFKFRINKYKKTLADYYNYFGHYPPANIWGKYQHYDEHSNMTADCQMHSCDSDIMASCDEMHACDSHMVADCNEMHACDSYMTADCEEMHQCDSHMIASCDEMHACDSYM